MQHRIDAPADGVVTEIGVSAGDQVEVGRVLAVVSQEES
jgi:propionyl-CoA carboxylase alpha chain